MQNLDYNDFTSFARRRAENWEHTFRNQPSNCLLCNPNDPADSCAFWPAEGPASVPLLFSELSWEKLILMLSSTSIFVPEMVSLCFWWTADLWNLSTDSWVYRDRSTWGSKCIFLRLRRNKNQAMCKYKYSKSGKKNPFWLNILSSIPKWQDLINAVFLLWVIFLWHGRLLAVRWIYRGWIHGSLVFSGSALTSGTTRPFPVCLAWTVRSRPNHCLGRPCFKSQLGSDTAFASSWRAGSDPHPTGDGWSGDLPGWELGVPRDHWWKRRHHEALPGAEAGFHSQCMGAHMGLPRPPAGKDLWLHQVLLNAFSNFDGFAFLFTWSVDQTYSFL